jgi:hypothetical protein
MFLLRVLSVFSAFVFLFDAEWDPHVIASETGKLRQSMALLLRGVGAAGQQVSKQCSPKRTNARFAPYIEPNVLIPNLTLKLKSHNCA